MYSAGLAEAAATTTTSGTGAAASSVRSSSPHYTASNPHHHEEHGGGGGGGPGWEQGDYRGAEEDWRWPQQGSGDAHSDDDALLVRWSEGLDFDM